MICAFVLPVGSSIGGAGLTNVPLLALSNGGADVEHCMAGEYVYSIVSPLTIGDGVSLGWMVGGVWLAAFGLMFLARAMRGETGGDYGNT